MQDRFGAIPHEGEELIKMVILRQKAQEIGIEKIYLKGGKMNLFFVQDNNETFYQSDLFGNILLYLPTSCFRNYMRKEHGRCIITVENVKDVETALAFMNEIQNFKGADFAI